MAEEEASSAPAPAIVRGREALGLPGPTPHSRSMQGTKAYAPNIAASEAQAVIVTCGPSKVARQRAKQAEEECHYSPNAPTRLRTMHGVIGR